MDIRNIEKLLADAALVSFDIFDTLILRLYAKPTDLFRHLEAASGMSGFCVARIEAERAARKKAESEGRHEVTMDEIYATLHPAYGKLREKEIGLELLMCKVNPEMKPIFDRAVQSGVPVYICSDMYLPRDVIEKMLKNAGYEGYAKLLLSSETLRPKATGEMYQDLIVLSGVPAGRILHIGDHPFTDVEMAEKEGLRAFRYEPPQRSLGRNLHSALFAILNRYAEKDVTLSVLEGMIVRREAEGKGDFWENFGYFYAGLVAYGYAKWLRGRMEAEGLERVVSLLRDGYIFGRVFQALYPDVPLLEMRASRRLFLFASAGHYEDIKDRLAGGHLFGQSYGMVYQRLYLDSEELHAAYIRRFPNQDAVISKKEEIEEVAAFWEAHKDILMEEGRRERELLGEYFDSEHFFDQGPVACIDLGWKGSLLLLLLRTSMLLGKDVNPSGFYLGTYNCDSTGLHIESYLLDHGKSTGASNADVLLDYGFTNQLMELVFSAPMYGTVKLVRQDGKIVPLSPERDSHEDLRVEISRKIAEGALAFAGEFKEIDGKYPLPLSKEAVLAPIEYLSREISKADERESEKVCYNGGAALDENYRPIQRQGIPAIGIVIPWPGDMSAESEVLTRFRRAAEENRMACVYLDNFGHILNAEDQKSTGAYVDAKKLTFVITTHYETPKVLDAFYYHALWNPPEIPLNLDYYATRVTDNYIMNDDYLIFDSGGMSNHLRSMLMNCPRTLEGASCLTPSFPRSALLEPNLDEPVMFYCGMNWEKVVHGTNRHNGLFKLLDETGKVKFYGPEQVEAWGGLRPWDGYKCYQYSIPFDGFSILKEINSCGVCLVLSSDIHRRAGAATTRVYEACAAGAVIISDDNEFMLRHFKDAALFIIYNKNDPRDTFRQIMEKFEWIETHREEALELARRAQEIFREKFCLDVQIRNIVLNHSARCEQIRKDLFAKDTSGKVLVTLVVNTQDEREAKRIAGKAVASVHAQVYPRIELGIAVDHSVAPSLDAYLETHCACAHVVPMALFDKKGSRQLTDGQAVRRLQTAINHDYYINTTPNEAWFYDHITTLIRAIENTGALCAYSGAAFEDCNKFRHINCFARLDLDYLYHVTKPERPLCPGQFLFAAGAHELAPDYLFDNLDGAEHLAYAGLIHYRNGGKLTFTHRMSMVFSEDFPNVGHTILPSTMQIRFIQDLLRYCIPEQGAVDSSGGSSDASKKTVWEVLSLLPLKNFIKLRYFRARMRKLPAKSTKYAKYEAKYNKTLEDLKRFYGI